MPTDTYNKRQDLLRQLHNHWIYLYSEHLYELVREDNSIRDIAKGNGINIDMDLVTRLGVHDLKITIILTL